MVLKKKNNYKEINPSSITRFFFCSGATRVTRLDLFSLNAEDWAGLMQTLSTSSWLLSLQVQSNEQEVT